MKLFKSDGRYNFHSQGYHYIAEFRWANTEERVLFAKLLDAFKELYGPDKEKVRREGYSYDIWQYNPEWRYEQKKSVKRRRIYLKDESSLTLAMLKV
jgi:hypothetical protein